MAAVVLPLHSTSAGLFSKTSSKLPQRRFGLSVSLRCTCSLYPRPSISQTSRITPVRRINQVRCNGESAALFSEVYNSREVEDPSACVLVRYEKKDDGVEPERPVPDDEGTPMWLEDTRDADQVIITTPLTVYVPEGYAVQINRCGSKLHLLGGLSFIIPFVDKIESKFQVCYKLAHLDINDFELTGEVKVLLMSSVYNEDMKKKMEEAISELSIMLQKEMRDAVGFVVTKTTNEKLQAKINEEATFYRVELKLKAFKPMSDIQNQARIQTILYMTEKKKEKRKEEEKILKEKTCRLLVTTMTTAALLKGVITKDWQEIVINSITLVLAAIASMS